MDRGAMTCDNVDIAKKDYEKKRHGTKLRVVRWVRIVAVGSAEDCPV